MASRGDAAGKGARQAAKPKVKQGKAATPKPKASAKKAPAKKAAAKKSSTVEVVKSVGKTWAKAAIAVLQDASSTTVQRLGQLALRMRHERQAEEPAFSDYTVVRPPSGSPVDSIEVQTVSNLGQGKLEQLRAMVTGKKAPKMEVVSHLDQSLVMQANDTALAALRRASPGLKMFQSTYLYPQYVHAAGDDMAQGELQNTPSTNAKRFEVRVTDEASQPAVGVRIKALVNWDGSHIPAVTNAQGVAVLNIPKVYKRVEVLLVEPEHTYWTKYIEGFARAAAPSRLEASVRTVLPDTFQLLGRYAPYDANAGTGVKVGVIDSGVGPHALLTVSGGAAKVTGDTDQSFADNGIGHGTHVAGIIAARRSGDDAEAKKAAYGLAPACTLMSYRVCHSATMKGRARSVDVAAALQQAIADQCDLVNISLGSLEAMPELPDVLEAARNAGIVVFAATGNDGKNGLRYPARYSHTLAVAALGRDGTFPDDSPASFEEGEVRRASEFVAAFSNHGESTDFIGPGLAVVSTFPGDRFAVMSGTSMSTPFTTGMAARLLSSRPELLGLPRDAARTDAIIRMLTESTRQPGFPLEFGGFGVLRQPS